MPLRVTVNCVCGNVTGFRSREEARQGKCIKCGRKIDMSKIRNLQAPPQKDAEDLDLLKVE